MCACAFAIKISGPTTSNPYICNIYKGWSYIYVIFGLPFSSHCVLFPYCYIILYSCLVLNSQSYSLFVFIVYNCMDDVIVKFRLGIYMVQVGVKSYVRMIKYLKIDF